MEKPYEMMVLYDGTLPEETVRSEHRRIEQLVKDNGTLDEAFEWGKRTLAYEIKGKRSGVYYLYRYTGEGDIPAKLYRTIKMTPSILRHLTVVRDPSVRTFADLARQKAEDEQRRASESEESAGHKKAVADRDEHSSEQGEQNA